MPPNASVATASATSRRTEPALFHIRLRLHSLRSALIGNREVPFPIQRAVSLVRNDHIMTTQRASRDETTVDVVLLLAAMVMPVVLMLLLEIAAWWAFGLDARGWNTAARVLLGLAGAGGLAWSVRLNVRYRARR